MQHRGHRRQTNVMVRFCTRPATIGVGLVINVSPTGAFMQTRIPLRVASVIYLEPTERPPADGVIGRIAATVVRSDGSGVGLEWCEFAAETTEAYAWLADGSGDSADRHQLTLPAVPEARVIPASGRP